MKKIFILALAAGGTLPALAQGPKSDYKRDSELSRVVLDINLPVGFNNQKYTTANTISNYPNALNANTGKLEYKNGYTYGANGQLGLFLGKQKHWGIGTGFMYMRQNGDAILDHFHIEYQATDFKGSTFRQVVTGNDVREHVMSTDLNIPLMLKYKNRFSKRWGFTGDIGALFNVQMKNAYSTHASFDYEAIYKFATVEGVKTTVYDNSPTPDVNDWMITKAEFQRNNSAGNMNDYFNAKRALGYSVGLNQPAGSSKGTVSYSKGSIGFMVQPAFNYFLSDDLALNFGAYYLYQPFKNTPTPGYRLADGSANYTSVLNNVTEVSNHSYGLNLGARFFFNRKKTPAISISSSEQNQPSQCELCDGGFTLHGLTPNVPVTVGFTLNGGQATNWASTVQPDGQVKINNLCAGTYSSITATIGKKKAMGNTIVVTDPVMAISNQNTTNPTATGVCDGSVKFSGLYATRPVTISYNLNGKAQAAYSGVVNADNTITISGLCEGRYSEIVATAHTCTAKGTDFTLSAPTPPPPPAPVVTPVTVTDETDISTPILFDINKTYINPSFYPIINEAAEEMKKNKKASMAIDGDADITGPEANNRTLSIDRANSVKHQLVKRGINPKRISTVGHGSRHPIATNQTVEGRQENRRAVMKITPPQK